MNPKSKIPGRARSGRQKNQSGMILATMVALIAVLAIIALSVALLVSNTLQSTKERLEKTESVNMADSGIDLAISWIQSQSYPPDDSTLHPLSSFYNASTDSQGRAVFTAPFGQAGTKLTIAIYSDSTNSGATQKHYMVESQSTMPSGATTIVRGYIQQNSFSKYAFFADIDSGGFWDYHNHFEGPFHSNCSDGKPSTFLWTTPAPEGPIFQYDGPGAFESTITPTWWKDSINNKVSPSSTSDWNAVATAGLSAISINSNNFIAMPQTDYLQEYVALGQTPPANPTSAPSSGVPTVTGVTVTTNGGIYIHGDSKSVTLSTDAANDQIFTVVTTPITGYTLTQTVTVSATGSSTTSVLKDATGTTISNTKSPASQYVVASTGPLNGMVFSDGNILSLSGTIADNQVDSNGNITNRNQWTLATDTGAGKDVTITNNLLYNTQRSDLTQPQSQDTNYNTRAGTLGILSRNVILSKTAPAQVAVDAVLFCTGSYKAEDATVKLGTSATMTSLGGVIVKSSGIFAYANSNGSLSSGWNEQYHYDTRMADHPPPFFPTTGSHYTVTSYQIVTSTLQ